MRSCVALFIAFMSLFLVTIPARAALIQVDLSTQTMRVTTRDGVYEWPVSSARAGYRTPRGTYGVQRLEAMHYSHKYHNSPMPHSIFFKGGYAIHGTYATASLGAPASHGCIRIAPENAAFLYNVVRHEGARIAITGTPDGDYRYAKAERRRMRNEMARMQAHQPGQPALGYAEPPRYAPTFDDWMRSPGVFSTPNATDYDPSTGF